jgi:hypothetical protein
MFLTLNGSQANNSENRGAGLCDFENRLPRSSNSGPGPDTWIATLVDFS